MWCRCLAELVMDEVTDQGYYVLVAAHTQGAAAACRGCGISSSRVHGHYRRLTQRYARRTMLLRRLLELMALALAGRAASRLLVLLGVGACRDTLIQLACALPDSGIRQVTVLGVDDFLERRGHSYATLMINMEPASRSTCWMGSE
jgi:hypothetical protein